MIIDPLAITLSNEERKLWVFWFCSLRCHSGPLDARVASQGKRIAGVVSWLKPV